MSGKLIARKGDKHDCPLHGEGEIIDGYDQHLVEGLPIARVGDRIQCPDGSIAIIEDNNCCMDVAGKKVARIGDKTSHGGTITTGASSVTAKDGKLSIHFGGKGKIIFGKNVHFGTYKEPSTTPTPEIAASAEITEPSEQALSLLKSIEQLRLQPYDDQTGKTITAWKEGATIGYGHLIAEEEWKTFKDGLTEAWADDLFGLDLEPFVAIVKKKLPVNISQQQFDAAVILAYNIGEKGFANSAVVKLINDPNAETSYSSLEHAWKAWNKSQGELNQGVINRRISEWNIYSKGVYKKW